MARLEQNVHDTAYEHGRLFFELYWSNSFRRIVDLGSQDVNGSLRDHCPEGAQYIGLDMMAAKGVDVVVDPGASLPIASDTVDAVVSSSAFEHDALFWNTFLELVRILRPGGLIYINAPSNYAFHRYPLDCWRFYPDAGAALVRWAARSGRPIELVESFVALPREDGWADFVAIFRKVGPKTLVRKGRIAERTRAANIYDLGMPVGGPLQAETLVMPDMATVANLAAEVIALKVDLETQALSTATLSASTAAAQKEAMQLREKAHAATLDIAGLEGALAAVNARLVDTSKHLAAIQQSRSWRVTAPIRWLTTSLRRQA